MKKWNKINPLQYGIVILFIINSTTLNISKNGYLLSIINFILGFIPLLIFIKILNYKKELNIYEKIDYLFNKLGSIINIILGILMYLLNINIYKNLLNFIHVNYLYDTNILLISIIISIALIYTCTKSLNVIFRLSTMLFYIISILFIISIIGLINQINPNNLVPINYNININYIYILPIFVLLMIPKQEILNNNKLNKYILIFYIIGNIIKILVVLFTILVLGMKLTNFYEFPEFVVLNKISTTGFFQRYEGILGIQWIYIIFITLCINLYYIKNLYIHLFNKHKDIFIIILIIITSIICSK